MFVLSNLVSADGVQEKEVKRKTIEMTFIQPREGQLRNTKEFIEKNWFAMDKIAKERGLMESYELLENHSDEDNWKLIVKVTYPSESGYEGVKETFEKIREQHNTVLVENKSFRELASVVKSIRVYSAKSINK